MTSGYGRCQTGGRADAPTGLWKTAARFPTPPTAHHHQVRAEEREEQPLGERPAHDNYPVQSVRSRLHPFAGPSPAEIVVVKRQ